jgi:hypothetical protein
MAEPGLFFVDHGARGIETAVSRDADRWKPIKRTLTSQSVTRKIPPEASPQGRNPGHTLSCRDPLARMYLTRNRGFRSGDSTMKHTPRLLLFVVVSALLLQGCNSEEKPEFDPAKAVPLAESDPLYGAITEIGVAIQEGDLESLKKHLAPDCMLVTGDRANPYLNGFPESTMKLMREKPGTYKITKATVLERSDNEVVLQVSGSFSSSYGSGSATGRHWFMKKDGKWQMTKVVPLGMGSSH